MTDFWTVRVAAIQATPVILDAEASIDKAVRALCVAVLVRRLLWAASRSA